MARTHFLHQMQLKVEELGCNSHSSTKCVLSRHSVSGIALDSEAAAVNKQMQISALMGPTCVPQEEDSVSMICCWMRLRIHVEETHLLQNQEYGAPRLPQRSQRVQFQVSILVGRRGTQAVSLFIRGKRVM